MENVPASLFAGAFHGTSQSPERRGQLHRAEHDDTLSADYAHFLAQAEKGGTLDQLAEEFSRYKSGLNQRCAAWLSSESRCVSSFIAGPSNFPVARMRKRSDIAHKRMGEYLDFRTRARSAVVRKLRPDLAPIMSSDADAIDRLAIQLAELERSQAKMKAANAAIRKAAKGGAAAQVAALVDLGFRDAQAAELIKPDFCGRIGFADYQLTNAGANMRRIKARIAQISVAQATPETAFEGSLARVEDCPAENRVRLFFPGKPDASVRSTLKSHGFRWSPTIGAWQNYRNAHSLAVASQIAGIAA